MKDAKNKALSKAKMEKKDITKRFGREIARDKEINRRHAKGEVLSGDIDYGKNRSR